MAGLVSAVGFNAYRRPDRRKHQQSNQRPMGAFHDAARHWMACTHQEITWLICELKWTNMKCTSRLRPNCERTRGTRCNPNKTWQRPIGQVTVTWEELAGLSRQNWTLTPWITASLYNVISNNKQGGSCHAGKSALKNCMWLNACASYTQLYVLLMNVQQYNLFHACIVWCYQNIEPS